MVFFLTNIVIIDTINMLKKNFIIKDDKRRTKNSFFQTY